MPNFILRVIRPVERTAEYEYIKEFFRFIGCLVDDYAVDDTSPANWINALIPEEKSKCVDVVMNCSEDPYLDRCKQLNIKRIYCCFDFNGMFGEITPTPLPTVPSKFDNKRNLRHYFLRELIKQIWDGNKHATAEIMDIAQIYLDNSVGEMFYFLQAKRNLRVLSMGEVLKERSAQVTNIALLPYVRDSLHAMWEAYCRLDSIDGSYSTYTQVNVAHKIYEIVAKLYDTERPRIGAIRYNGVVCAPPELDVLIQKLEDVVCTEPGFVSAYLLMANIFRESAWKADAEERCYCRLWQSVAQHSRDYAFIWYRNAYFYEKRKKNLDKALEYYQNAVQLNPNCYQAWFKLGYYAAADNRFNQAESMLRKMIQSIFHGRSTDPDENGVYTNWLALSPKESQYIYKAYILLAKIALNKNEEHAIKEYIGRACMAATIFEEATVVRQVSNFYNPEGPYEESFEEFISYHRICTPVWAMWQVLSPWSESVIQDYFVRDIVRQRLELWSPKYKANS